MYLSLLDQFQCAAEQCPDDCCHGWGIDVDVQTIGKWNELADPIMQKTIADSTVHVADGLLLKRDEQGQCAFLADGLCSLQNQLGHEWLPQTCREYPRVMVGRDTAPVRSAYMSCPELVRLLLDAKPEELFSDIQVESKQSLKLDPLYVEKVLNRLQSQVLIDSSVKHGEALYFLASNLIELLTSRDISQKIQELEVLSFDRDRQASQINKIRKSFRNRQLRIKKQQAGEFWMFVIKHCRPLFSPVFSNDEFTESAPYKNLLAAVEQNNALDVYRILLNLKQKADPVCSEFDHELRNYLLLKFVNHGFPMACHHQQFQAVFVECITGFFQILLLLWLQACSASPSRQYLNQVIYRVERALVHNDHLEETLNTSQSALQMQDYMACFLELAG